MALDGIVLANLVSELKIKLLNKKINKILQHNNDNIILQFSAENLLLSANPTFPRLYTIKEKVSNDDKISNFCQSLRKYITGGILQDITQDGLDRILTFKLLCLNDFKEHIVLNLILEIMGKHSNLILTTEDNIIIDAHKLITPNISSIRNIIPKLKYDSPAVNQKFNLLDTTTDKINELLEKNQNLSFVDFVTANFQGITKTIAEEFIFSKNLCDISDSINCLPAEELVGQFKTYVNSLISVTEYSGYEFENTAQSIIDFHVTNLTHLNANNIIKFDSVSEMLENYYLTKARSNNISQRSSDIKTIITNAMHKATKKKELHTSIIKDSKSCDIYKVFGDLIYSNIYSIKQGQKETTLFNFYDNEDVKITLNPELSPSENANAYYNKYNKKKSALKHSTLQLKEIDEEIVYLETILSYLENAISFNDIDDIKNELISEGYIRKRNTKKKSSKHEESKPYKFISSDNFDIYVGRNNIQNDEVTFKLGRDSDLWLHVQDIPGSHVIIKNPEKREIPESTLIEAANLGVFFSKGRMSTNVAIDYTERKFVKKPNGSKPGFVIYLNNKTLYITPNKEILSKFNISF